MARPGVGCGVESGKGAEVRGGLGDDVCFECGNARVADEHEAALDSVASRYLLERAYQRHVLPRVLFAGASSMGAARHGGVEAEGNGLDLKVRPHPQRPYNGLSGV